MRDGIFKSVHFLLFLIFEGDKNSQRDLVSEKEIKVEEI